MSHLSPGLISAYNSLTDKHLTGYFNNTRIRRHLQRVGLITRSGRIVPDKEYRHKLIQRAHQRNVRDCLAQAIFHKVLEMERVHQIEIKRKLEEFARRERVHKIKVDRSKRYEEEVIHILSPRPPTGPRGGRTQHSGPEGENSESSESPGSSRPNTAPGKMQRPVRLKPIHSNSTTASHRRSSPYRTHDSFNEADRPFNCTVDKESRRHVTMTEFSRGISPYRLPVINNFVTPVPPPTKRKDRGPKGLNSSLRGRRLRPTTAPTGPDILNEESPMLRTSVLQSGVGVNMVFYGKTVHLSHDMMDMRDEVKVFQQHCGGENLCVYKGMLCEGDTFQLVSRRHRGFPFSLTFFLNGLQVERLSSCCEFKHRKGSRLGGRHGHFGVCSVEGASPCYKCIIALGLDKMPTPPPKRVKEDVGGEATVVSPTETTADAAEMEGEGTGTTRHPRDMETEVQQEPPEENKARDDYEEDFEADDEGPAEDGAVTDNEPPPPPSREREGEGRERDASDSEEEGKDEGRRSHSPSSSSGSDREDSETEADAKEDQAADRPVEPEEDARQVDREETPPAKKDEPAAEDAGAAAAALPQTETSTAAKESGAQDSPGDNTGSTELEVPSGNEGKGDGDASRGEEENKADKTADECTQEEEPERPKSVQEKLAEAILKEAQCSSEPELSDTSTEESSLLEESTDKGHQQDSKDTVPEKSVTFSLQQQTHAEEVKCEESAVVAGEAVEDQGEENSEQKEKEDETAPELDESAEKVESDGLEKNEEAEKAASELDNKEDAEEKDESEVKEEADVSLHPEPEEKPAEDKASEPQADEPEKSTDTEAVEKEQEEKIPEDLDTKPDETKSTKEESEVKEEADTSLHPESEEKTAEDEASEPRADEPEKSTDTEAVEKEQQEEKIPDETERDPEETKSIKEDESSTPELTTDKTGETAALDNAEVEEEVTESEVAEMKAEPTAEPTAEPEALGREEAPVTDAEKQGDGEAAAGSSNAEVTAENSSSSSEGSRDTTVHADNTADTSDVKREDEPAKDADKEVATGEASSVEANADEDGQQGSVKDNQMSTKGEEENEESVKVNEGEDEAQKAESEEDKAGDEEVKQDGIQEVDNVEDEEKTKKTTEEAEGSIKDVGTTGDGAEDDGDAGEKAQEDGGEGNLDKGDKIAGEETVKEAEQSEKDEDSKVEDSKYEDSKVEDSKDEDSKDEDSKVEDSKVEDSKDEDSKVEDGKVEDGKDEDSKVEEGKYEDGKVEDSKDEDGKVEDSECVKADGELEEKVTTSEKILEGEERSQSTEEQPEKTAEKEQSNENTESKDTDSDNKAADDGSNGATTEDEKAAEIVDNVTEVENVQKENEKDGTNSEKDERDTTGTEVDAENAEKEIATEAQKETQEDETSLTLQDKTDTEGENIDDKHTEPETKTEGLNETETGEGAKDHGETSDHDKMDQSPDTDRVEKESKTEDANIDIQSESRHGESEPAASVVEVKEEAKARDETEESKDPDENIEPTDSKESAPESEDKDSDVNIKNDNVQNNVNEVTVVSSASQAQSSEHAANVDNASHKSDGEKGESNTPPDSEMDKRPNTDTSAADVDPSAEKEETGADTEEASKPSEEGASVVLKPRAEFEKDADRPKTSISEDKEADIPGKSAVTPESLEKQDNRDLVKNWVNLHQESKCFETFVEPLDDLKGSTASEGESTDDKHTAPETKTERLNEMETGGGAKDHGETSDHDKVDQSPDTDGVEKESKTEDANVDMQSTLNGTADDSNHNTKATESENATEQPRLESPITILEMSEHKADDGINVENAEKDADPTTNDVNESEDNTKVEAIQSDLGSNRSKDDDRGENVPAKETLQIKETEVTDLTPITETEHSGEEDTTRLAKEETGSEEHKGTSGISEEDKDKDVTIEREPEQNEISKTEVESIADTNHSAASVKSDNVPGSPKEDDATKDKPGLNEKQTVDENRDHASPSKTEDEPQGDVESPENVSRSSPTDKTAGEPEDTKDASEQKEESAEVTEITDLTTTSTSDDSSQGDSQGVQLRPRQSEGSVSGENKMELIEDIKHTVSKDQLSTLPVEETTLFGRTSYPPLAATRTESGY